MVNGKVRELIEIQDLPELGIRREVYRVVKTGTVYEVYRDKRTGRFIRRPKFVKITMSVVGEYPSDIKRRGKGAHPFWIEMQVTKSMDFKSYVEERKKRDAEHIIIELFDEYSDEIRRKTVDKLMKGFEVRGKRMPAWDERAEDMVYSENWIQDLRGVEFEVSDIEEEEEEIVDWGR